MSVETRVKLVVGIIGFIIILFFLFMMNLTKMENIQKGKKKKNKDIKFLEVQFLAVRYKIVKERLYTRNFAFLFAFLNAFIICGTFIFIDFIPWPFAFQLLVGFVLLFGLIYAIYGILGSILVKRGYQNEL